MGVGLFGGIAFGQYTESFEVSPFKAGVYGSLIARSRTVAVVGVSDIHSTSARSTTRAASVHSKISSERGRGILK